MNFEMLIRTSLIGSPGFSRTSSRRVHSMHRFLPHTIPGQLSQRSSARSGGPGRHSNRLKPGLPVMAYPDNFRNIHPPDRAVPAETAGDSRRVHSMHRFLPHTIPGQFSQYSSAGSDCPGRMPLSRQAFQPAQAGTPGHFISRSGSQRSSAG
jgi:hypothetical protein